MSRLQQRLTRLENQATDSGSVFNKVVGGFRLIGHKLGVLKVPVITPEQWERLADRKR